MGINSLDREPENKKLVKQGFLFPASGPRGNLSLQGWFSRRN
ncbi:hypothetical protein LEP1GSC047_3787 [Leptospira inadai serovar Lyme str. 10]|uniref:Uncharacterized protein n=1 Tax=Leptospira inadai serovar Lyme str. 10 TaxID=1049790 RepID=V6HM79_9LEPT|nr:hypothetical protein LEP1GSC047_3787 [Leptospira inadai serovar Lyme str. 10]